MENAKVDQRFVVESKSAFDGKTLSYRIRLCDIKQSTRESETHKVQAILDETHNTIAEILKEALTYHSTIQVTLNLEGSFDEYDYKILNFEATRFLSSVDLNYDVEKHLEKAKAKILWKCQEYDTNNKGSKHYHYLYLYIHKVAPEDYIVDVLSNDNMSFKWSVLAALHPGKSIEELNMFSSDLIMDDIDYPVQLDDIPRIEEKNIFSINVYMLKYFMKTKSNEIVGPVYHTRMRQKLHINLLLQNENGKRRFSYLRDLSCIMYHFCDGCLNRFKNKSTLELHQREECLRIKTILPKQKKVKFRNTEYTEFLPFVVYAHFETLQFQVINNVKQASRNQQNKVWAINTHKHLPYSYGYYIKCVDDNFSKARINCWEQDLHECIPNFTDNLIKDLKEQWTNFKSTYPKTSIKYIPVIMQDIKNNGYHIIRDSNCDSFLLRYKHFIGVQKKISIGDGANKVDLRFLDIRNFVNEKKSLRNMIGNIRKEGYFKEMQGLIDMRDVTILTENEIKFPRYYVKLFEHLQVKTLPSGHDYYNDINNELYEYARRVWKHFRCNNIGEYLRIYIKSNIFLLANIIEQLRLFCKTNYEDLDMVHYYTIAGFSWDAMLKITEMELDLLSDVEMLNFIKKGIRGGYVQCNKRHAVANNTYLPDSFDDGKDKSYIMYLDANNLAGHAMCQSLPYAGFEWVDVNVNYKLPENSEIGYILEVDLCYPIELHDNHSDLPFCPEKKDLHGADQYLVADFFPKYRYVIHHSFLTLCVNNGLRIEKIHRVLKFKQKPWLKGYIELNTERRQNAKTKFEQNFFKLLNNCIYGKTIENVATGNVIRLFHKWENTGYKEKALSSIGRPDFCNYIVCSESTIAINFRKTELTFRSPVYVGFSVLDLQKTQVYKFHYDLMKKRIGENLSLLYTDTDSLIYQFRNVNSYEFIKKYVNNTIDQIPGLGFDTSDYKSDNEFDIPQRNHREIGYFKDELKGCIVKEFIGLKARTFAIIYKDDNGNLVTKKEAAFVPERVTDKLEMDDYKTCLLDKMPLYKEDTRNRATDHIVYTQSVKRMVLSPYDPKRCILPDGVNTLPWGHYKIRTMGNGSQGPMFSSGHHRRPKF